VTPGDLLSAWDHLSPIYQAHHEFTTRDVHYGPWAPLERELQLLGDVEGLRILDLGCGGGQCSIAFARQGAIVTGVDFSEVQLAHARRLAAQEDVAVRLVQASAEDLSALGSGAYDLVFSVNTLIYVARAAACLAECCRVLVRGGRLVLSLDHPLRHSFLDPGLTNLDDELSIVPVRSYYDEGWHRWRWPGSGIVLQSYHRTIGQWTDLLAAAGLQLLRIVEPLPPADLLDNLLPEDGAQAPLRLIPHTVIFIAQKG
jgi:SAM-dependent methyltransferase